MPPASSEFRTKIDRLRSLLNEHRADALLLRRVSSFAWATCGAASYVNTASTEGAASLVITREHLFLVTNNIESPRLEQEEKLAEQGWEFHVSPWHSATPPLQTLTSNGTLVSDSPFPGSIDIGPELARLRARLTPEEGERFRELGRLCAETLTSVAQTIHPGMSEFELAALLGNEAQQRGVQPIVNLVATDERVSRYRHPLPTAKKMDQYAMLVLCGRRQGLVCSLTRLVHFGPIPDDLRRRIRASAQVNAVLIAHSRPGQRLGDLLIHGQQAYAEAGFPDEWQRHHQGGIAGYEPRECLATPDSIEEVAVGQTLAWNPSISGAKSEDTILVGAQSNEILTSTSLWPVEQIEITGQSGAIPCALALEF